MRSFTPRSELAAHALHEILMRRGFTGHYCWTGVTVNVASNYLSEAVAEEIKKRNLIVEIA